MATLGQNVRLSDLGQTNLATLYKLRRRQKKREKKEGQGKKGKGVTSEKVVRMLVSIMHTSIFNGTSFHSSDVTENYDILRKNMIFLHMIHKGPTLR